MRTSDWALIISLCSFAVALGSFVWNVWSKFIYPKAKIRVTFQATVIIQPGAPEHRPEFLTLTATNFGPGDVTLHSAILYHQKKTNGGGIGAPFLKGIFDASMEYSTPYRIFLTGSITP